MAFGLSSLGFGSKKSKSSTSTQEDTTGSKTEIVSGKSATDTSQTGKTTALDTETQSFIKTLLEGIGAQFGQSAGSMQELAQAITTRAQSAEGDIAQQIAPIVTEARRTGEQQIGTLETNLAKQAGGSKGNTLVTAATADARSGLETQLASLAAQLTLQGREVGTNELGLALSSLGAAPDSSGLVGLLNILKGSTLETEQAGSEQQTLDSKTLTDFEQFIKSIGTSKSKESGFDIGFGIL